MNRYTSAEVETLSLLASIKSTDPGTPKQDKKGHWVFEAPNFLPKK